MVLLIMNVLMTSKSLIDQFDSFDDIKKFFNLDNQVELPLHPPSYQDSSGLPNYQDTFQVNMIETQHLVRIMTILGESL